MVEKGMSATEQKNGIAGSRGSSVKGILFVLFALAVCFGYFYFFTDVLRSKEETPGQPDVYSSEVRKPLPERLGQPSATSTEEAASPPSAVSSLPENPASGSAASSSQVSPGKVSTAQQSLKQVERKAALSPGVAKSSARKGSAPGKENIKSVTRQKSAAKKVSKIPAKHPVPKELSTKKQPGTIKAGERYTLVVGNYVLKSSLRADKAKLEKSGLPIAVLPGAKKSEPMNRLLIAEVSSSQAAQEELAKLKKASKDAFFLRENGKYAIYAGSYFAHKRAVQEQERLRKQGFAPILKKSLAPVSTYSLTAGRYPTREAALKGAELLKKLGFKPYPAELPK
ncbi:MAG: SPOR domain-containing protein [Geobacteraceae bacterium]